MYDLLLQTGLKYEELYDMTLWELKNTLEQRMKGVSYFLWKTSGLNKYVLAKSYPKSPQEANPELYPFKKVYAMPEVLKEEYLKQKGVKTRHERE